MEGSKQAVQDEREKESIILYVMQFYASLKSFPNNNVSNMMNSRQIF